MFFKVCITLSDLFDEVFMAVSGSDALQGYSDINMPWFIDRGVVRVYGDHSVAPEEFGEGYKYRGDEQAVFNC